jgi:hypothetical protein
MICSVVAIVEEPLWLSEGSVRVLNEPVPKNLGRGGNRGSRSHDLVTIEVQAFAPVGPGRNQQDPRMAAKSPREDRESGAVLEETAPSGEPQAS